jgi:CRP-like cAMP-binding protein
MVMTLSAPRSALANITRILPRPEPPDPNGAPPTLNDYLRALHPYSSRQSFARGETIFSEGEPSEHIYKVVSGAVRLCRDSSDGRRHITDFALPGDLIGFLECPDQPATAEAISDTMLVSYPRATFDRMAAHDPRIRSSVLCHLSTTLLDAHRHLFVLGCQSAKERLASFLLRLSDRLDIFAGERLDMPMGREDIANHLGLTVETVCRAIASLKSDRIISVPNCRQIMLTDVARLRTLAIEC